MKRAARHLTAIAVALPWLGMNFASAQDVGSAETDNPTSEESAEIEEIVVRGQRMSEIDFDLRAYINDFIGEVVSLPPGGGFARWHLSVCIGVNNLDRGAAQYLVDRISLLADEVGLDPGEPGCPPQVMVIFTTDARQLATQLVERQPEMFRPGGGSCCMNLSRDALDEFQQSDAPVRWWHVSAPVDELGIRVAHVGRDGFGKYRWVDVRGPSRVHNGLRDELQKVIIIADSTKLSGTSWQQLGDYLAVISLAQINPNTDPAAFDSILNLFSNPAAYSGLTDWDRAYVRSLYDINLYRYPDTQQSAIVGRMVMREDEAAESDDSRSVQD